MVKQIINVKNDKAIIDIIEIELIILQWNTAGDGEHICCYWITLCGEDERGVMQSVVIRKRQQKRKGVSKIIRKWVCWITDLGICCWHHIRISSVWVSIVQSIQVSRLKLTDFEVNSRNDLQNGNPAPFKPLFGWFSNETQLRHN